MSYERPVNLGAGTPYPSAADTHPDGGQRRPMRDQRDEQQLADDARRMRDSTDKRPEPLPAATSPSVDKRTGLPATVRRGQPDHRSDLDGRLALQRSFILGEELCGDRTSQWQSDGEDATTDMKNRRDGRETGPDRQCAPLISRHDDREQSDNARPKSTSTDKPPNAMMADLPGVPSPFAGLGVRGQTVRAPAPAPMRLAQLDGHLAAIARRLLVKENDGGGPSVQIELDEELLPGVVVDMFEADGGIVAQFTSRHDDTRRQLEGAAPWLAQSLASSLQRDALVRVLAENAAQGPPVEIRALPKDASPPQVAST